MASVAIVATGELAAEVVPGLIEAAVPLLEEAGAEVIPLVSDVVSNLGESIESVYFSVKEGVVDIASQTTKSILGDGGRAVVHLVDPAGNIVDMAVGDGAVFSPNVAAGIGGAVGSGVGTAAVAGVIYLIHKLFDSDNNDGNNNGNNDGNNDNNDGNDFEGGAGDGNDDDNNDGGGGGGW